MTKSVGIVIPSYNQGRFIKKAINSVIENRQHINIRIAVIDGGSSDESVEIIKSYENQLDYWCSEKDNGQADAINKGFDRLQGCDYYMWLNSDDIYESNHAIYDIVTFAEEGNYQVVYGKSHFIDENDTVIGEYPVREYSKELLGKTCFLSQPSVMFSSEAMKKVGPINANLHMCLDYEYWIRLAQEYSFGLCEEYIGATRMHSDTKTANNQTRNISEGLQIIKHYYKDYPISWVASAFLENNTSKIIKSIPKRILFIFLYPIKGRLAEKFIEDSGIKYKTIVKD